MAAPSGPGIEVFSWNGTSLSVIATYTHGAPVYGIDWSPDNNYLAMAGDPSSSVDTRVLNFTGTALNLISNYSHGADVYSISWSPKGDYIVIGGVANTGGLEIETLSGLQFPAKHKIINNTISTVNGPAISTSAKSTNSSVSSGRGVSASSTTNLIMQNTAFECDINYTFVTNTYSQYLVNTLSQFPNISANLSFPPL